MKKYLIIIVIFFFIGVGVTIALSYYTGAYFKIEERIVIKEIEKPVIRYVKTIERTDLSGLYSCYKTPISIKYSMRDDRLLSVIATDGCKQTDQNIKLGVVTSGNWKMYAAIGTGAFVAGTAVTAYLAYKLK